MDSKELSILLPTYNADNINFKKCLKSIKSQSFKNFELLVIDNESSDTTLKTIKEFKFNHRIISKKDNSFNDGVNKGLKKVKSKYFTIIASDDLIKDKNYLKNLINFIKSNKDVDIVFPGYCEIINNKFYKKKQSGNFSKFAYDIIVPGLGWIAKKSVINHSHFPTDLKACSDYYFLLNLFKKNFIFKRLNGPNYCMRIGGNSFINAFISFKERRDISNKFGGNKYRNYIKFYILCLKFIIKFKIISLFYKDLEIKK